jgi:hypothetical protein
MAYVIDTRKRLMQLIFLGLVVGVGLWSARAAFGSITYTNEPDGYYSTNEATTTVADEYMPKWVTNKPTQHAYDRLVFYQGRGVIRIGHMNAQSIDVSVDASEESIIQINTLYYPGWGASLDDTKVLIDYSNSEGVMRITVPAGSHHLVLAFRETISRFLADCASLVSFVIYIVLLFL